MSLAITANHIGKATIDINNILEQAAEKHIVVTGIQVHSMVYASILKHVPEQLVITKEEIAFGGLKVLITPFVPFNAQTGVFTSYLTGDKGAVVGTVTSKEF